MIVNGNVRVHVVFTGTLSSTSYVAIGVEALRHVVRHHECIEDVKECYFCGEPVCAECRFETDVVVFWAAGLFTDQPAGTMIVECPDCACK